MADHRQPHPQAAASPLHPYFHQLVCYAKFVVDHRPGQVVPHKNLSSGAWRKEHWEQVIADGRAHQVDRLPNPSSIDSWFDLFRAYKRDLGVKNVPARTYLLAPPRGSRPIGHDRHFDRLLLQHQSQGPHEKNRDDCAPITISDSESAPHSDNESDLGLRGDSPPGPVTRSRSKQTVVASKYQHSIAPSAEAGRVTPPDLEIVSSRVDAMMRPPAIPKPHQPLAHPARTNLNQGGTTPAPATYTNQYVDDNQRLGQQRHAQHQQQMYGNQETSAAYGQSGSVAPIAAPVGAVEFVNLIASGGQGSVFLARLALDRNSLFIVKVFYKEPSQHEVSAMRAMSLTNYSIRLIGETRVTESQLRRYEHKLQQDGIDFDSFHFDRSGCLTGWCFERLHSDLERALLERKAPGGNIGNAMKQLIALQIAYFIRGIHRSNYIFRDLKPSNVLLCFPPHKVPSEQVVRFFLEHQPVIKVADYGLVTSERSSKKTRNAGTMGYMPSAQMASENYDQSVDVTAYCVTLTELLTDDLLYDTNDPDSEIEEDFRTLNVADKVRQRFRAHRTYIPSALTDLILKTLRNENRDIEPFIAFFESSLKSLAFSLDIPRKDMSLLHPDATATPARMLAVPKSW